MYCLLGCTMAGGLGYLSLLYLKYRYTIVWRYSWLWCTGMALYGAIWSWCIPSAAEWVLCLLFSNILLLGATIDQHYYILPDEGVFLLICGSLVWWHITDVSGIDCLIQALAVTLVLLCIRWLGRGGLGWGDIKWGFGISLWLPWGYGMYLVTISFYLGMVWTLGQYIVTRFWPRCIPFGPYLTTAGLLLLIVSRQYLWGVSL